MKRSSNRIAFGGVTRISNFFARLYLDIAKQEDGPRAFVAGSGMSVPELVERIRAKLGDAAELWEYPANARRNIDLYCVLAVDEDKSVHADWYYVGNLGELARQIGV